MKSQVMKTFLTYAPRNLCDAYIPTGLRELNRQNFKVSLDYLQASCFFNRSCNFFTLTQHTKDMINSLSRENFNIPTALQCQFQPQITRVKGVNRRRCISAVPSPRDRLLHWFKLQTILARDWSTDNAALSLLYIETLSTPGHRNRKIINKTKISSLLILT